MSKYFVYILECSDKTYYTGYTTDLSRRVKDHNTSPKGAKYTLGRRPNRLVYFEEFDSGTLARQREFAIKSLTRDQKSELINHFNTENNS